LKLSFQKEMVFLPGARAILTYLEGGKLRVVGTLTMPLKRESSSGIRGSRQEPSAEYP
jgi:hypothetical protein